MLRIYATWIITRMTNIPIKRQFTIIKQIRKTMRLSRLAVYLKIAISLFIFTTSPYPTRRSHMRHNWTIFINFVPKSIFRCDFSCFSKTRYTSFRPYKFTTINTRNFFTWHKNTPFGTGCLFVVTQIDSAKRGKNMIAPIALLDNYLSA